MSVSVPLQKAMQRPDAVSYLRGEAYFAYLDGRIKRAKLLNKLADQCAKRSRITPPNRAEPPAHS